MAGTELATASRLVMPYRKVDVKGGILRVNKIKKGANAFFDVHSVDPLIIADVVNTVVRSVLVRVSEHFCAATASSSGKYHLEDECQDGGLVLHTRRVVRMAHTIYGLPWYSQ